MAGQVCPWSGAPTRKRRLPRLSRSFEQRVRITGIANGMQVSWELAGNGIFERKAIDAARWLQACCFSQDEKEQSQRS